MGDASRYSRCEQFDNEFLTELNALEQTNHRVTIGDDDIIIRCDGQVLFDPGAELNTDLIESIAATLKIDPPKVDERLVKCGLKASAPKIICTL